MPCQVEGFDLAGLIGTSILWSQEYQRGSSGFFSFLRCQFLGIGERAGSEGSISGMSDFGFFWRFFFGAGLGREGRSPKQMSAQDWVGR